MKRLNFVQYGMALVLLFTALMTLPLNAQIIADGNEHTVDAIGQTIDISLPNNPDIAFITFRLVGGDGGYAQVLDKIGGEVLKANGGSGAYVTATFPVGNGPHEIPPGSIFRFMEGRSGQNGSSDAILGKGEDFGGGGGGTGILYKENSTSPYKLLAVAGGGGGAHQGMLAGSSIYHKPGQSGRTGTSGGSGNGSQYFNEGGKDGQDGGDGSVGDGGGVRTATSSLRTSAYTHGGCDPCDMGAFGLADIRRAGGTGYGRGGYGLGVSFISIGTGTGGGGGGGYSGGGFGGIVGSGGGGGSYVNPIATSHSMRDEGTDPTPDHGWITYQVTLNQRPVAKCKEAMIYLDENGLATLYPSDINIGSFDPDGSIVEWSLSKTSFDCDDVGSNQVTLTVTDNIGSKATCEANANMMDARAPTARCKDITVQLDAAGVATIDGEDVDNGSSDNCSIESMTVTPNTFDCSNIGSPVTVTLTVTDESGNKSSCTASVTVEDDEDPVITCPADITVSNDPGMCGAKVSFNATATDNCSAVVTYSQDPGTFFPIGTTTVSAIATDSSGNTDACIFDVTVEDHEDPVITCPADITVSNDPGMCGAKVSVNATATDNCSALVTYSQGPGTFFPVGTTTVTATATDPSGNTAVCSFDVTVEDNEKPLARCKPPFTIKLDHNGKASITPLDVDAGSSDNCGLASLTVSPSTFTCADIGTNTVLLTVTDIHGNSSTCTTDVTVEDNIVPTVRTQNVTITLDKEGKGSVTPHMVDNGSTDNCTIVDMWLEGETDYDCGDTGEHEVVLKARDQSGNVGSYNAFVKVEFYKPEFINKHNVSNGDTIHRVDCQVPWNISFRDLDGYRTLNQHGSLTTHLYKEDLPENAPWGMYALWRYEYVFKDACYNTYKFNYFLALYDLSPPTYQNFPNDTTVASAADVPEVNDKVKIIDVCQYVVWDTVMTFPVITPEQGDTIGFTRRWMARDPSGHKSFRDQMIWLDSGDRNHHSMIRGRIANEHHLQHARFPGEAGMNGIPVSLYRIDTDSGTRTWVRSWTTGDWMGEQGVFYFLPEHPGNYQVRVDSSLCLIDTLLFDNEMWSDTLVVSGGESVDLGWIFTRDCGESAIVFHEEGISNKMTKSGKPQRFKTQTSMEWRVYPNPANGYLYLDVNSEQEMDYQLFDILGRQVKFGKYHKGQSIDVRGLDTGMYYLQLSEQDHVLGTKSVMLNAEF